MWINPKKLVKSEHRLALEAALGLSAKPENDLGKSLLAQPN